MAAPAWWTHAFAVGDDTPFQPTEAQHALVERVAGEVVRRRLTTPALVVLELCGPLNFVSAQALHFFQPLVAALQVSGGYDAFAAMLEHRGALDYIRTRIDAADALAKAAGRAPA
jgi:hypothetical protein